MAVNGAIVTGEGIVPISNTDSYTNRKSRIAVFAIITFVALSMRAHAATPVLYAAGGKAWTTNNPNGSLSQPAGALFIGTHVWVGDMLTGYRLDADPNGVTLPQTAGYLISAPLTIQATGQISYDAVHNMTYSPERQAKGHGIFRSQFYSYNEAFVNGCLIGAGALGGRRPTATALGPDGQLYIGFESSGDIVRIDVGHMNNQVEAYPNCAAVEPAEVTIGKSEFGSRVSALTFIGNDLYITGKDGLGVIRFATGCASGCVAAQVPGSAFRVEHTGLVSDGRDAVYYSRNNAVFVYHPSTGAHTQLATGGVLPDGSFSSFAFVEGKTNTLYLDPSGNLWIGDDLSGGIYNLFGRLFVMQAPLQ